MFRTISNVVKHRICRRAPKRHAMCEAAGEGTEREVAGTLLVLHCCDELWESVLLNWGEISMFSILRACNWDLKCGTMMLLTINKPTTGLTNRRRVRHSDSEDAAKSLQAPIASSFSLDVCC